MDWTPMASWPLLMTILGSATCFALFGSTGDVLLLASAGIWQLRFTILNYLLGTSPPWSRIGLAVVVLSVGASVFRIARRRGGESPSWEGHGKVMLLPCRTTHARLFPKKHSFSYSYLVAGIPVGWEGSAGAMVSAGASQEASGTSPERGRSWYHVDARDHLERGSGHLGLRGKLDAYLKSQGVDPTKYPHAYLVTAPRFLGYQFNPASFWYLYDAERALAAMIVEVNNTFDERRMYYLVPDNEYDDASAPATRFTQTWPKDFHVSPFNSRKGSYSIMVTDPLKPAEQATGPINVTIVLRSSKEHGKIVARLFSTTPGVDPSYLSALQKCKFLARWGWVGFLTFPRIVKEAGGLFFKRRLHVRFRPEPLRESIGRRADATERSLEAVFRRYLRHVVEQSAAALAVKYIPAGYPASSSELMLSPAAGSGSGPVEELEIKVLTPVFYSRFVGYAHDQEAFFCELRESSTIWMSRPELLPKFVMKKPPPPLQVSSITDYVFFKAIQYLRRRPKPIERPMTWPASSHAAHMGSHSIADIRGFRISSMDGYVLGYADGGTRSMYRSAVLKLFLAERTAWGAVPLLEAQFFMMRALVAWAFWRNVHQEITARP